jgi:hypothetical protein
MTQSMSRPQNFLLYYQVISNCFLGGVPGQSRAKFSRVVVVEMGTKMKKITDKATKKICDVKSEMVS